jgi:hypothetical protein
MKGQREECHLNQRQKAKRELDKLDKKLDYIFAAIVISLLFLILFLITISFINF